MSEIQDLSVYKKKTPVEHVLSRPEMYIGSIILNEKECYTADIKEEEIKYKLKNIITSDGLERLFLEIISNAGDNVNRSIKAGVDPGKIVIDIKGGVISVYNEGLNMPTERHPEYKTYIPQMLLGELLTGSNFDDEEERKLGGRNGIGAKAANIFSKLFIVEIGDKKNKIKYQQVFQENMTICNAPKITENYNDISYTKITYVADFIRFYSTAPELGLQSKNYTEDMIQLFTRHCIDLAFTTGVEVIINGRSIKIKDLNDYGKLYITNPVVNFYTYNDINNQVIIYDTPDKGKCISFVNGIYTEKGGIHVNTCIDKIFVNVIDKFKKHEISKKDIKPHITIILSCKLDKPKFKTQTKDFLTAPKPIFNIDEKSLTNLLKWNLINRISTGIQAKTLQKFTKTDGKKTTFVTVKKLKDAQWAGTKRSKDCCLFITEGDSASTAAIKGIGEKRDYYGSYPLKGKPLNTSKSDDETRLQNQEISDLKKLIGLEENVDYTLDNNFFRLRYGSIIIMADQDPDGFHIRGLILNIFRQHYVSLLKRGYVKVMETPLVKVTKNKLTKKFYNMKEYHLWLKTDEAKTSKWTEKYYKGLGTLTDKDIREEFKNPRISVYEYDERAELFLSLAFNPGNEDLRKKWISSYLSNPNHNNSTLIKPGTISHFINTELTIYSADDIHRSLPSLCDGLKQGQRKVIFATRSKKGSNVLKVTQLSGLVSASTKYTHGEKSLEDIIINLAQCHIGTNNLPLLSNLGQFGSREGKDAAAGRYISVFPSPLLKWIFRSEDDIILDHITDEDTPIEPRFFLPIIPLFAFNGSEGIATGFSTSIPCYHPLTIIKWLQIRILKWESEKPIDYPILSPWYRGYQGIIKKIGSRWHSQGSYSYSSNGSDIIVTELPVTTTIKNYQAKLEKKKDKGMLKDFKNISFAAPIKGLPDQDDLYPRFQIHGFVNPNLRSLGLDSVIGDKNITLLDHNNFPKKYSSIEEALEAFSLFRRSKYQDRINKHLPQLRKKLDLEKKRFSFVTDVINKDLILHGKDDSLLLQELSSRNYPESFLTMQFRSCTTSKLSELQSIISSLEKEISFYSSITPTKLWWSELQELYKKLEPLYK